MRVGAVVGHAGQRAGLVGAVAGLEPGEAGAQVLGDAEAQAVFPAAFCHSPTTSRLGPMLTAFQRWSFEFQRKKLSWCEPMLTKYRAPAFL